MCRRFFISSGYSIERGKFVDVIFYTESYLYWYRTTSYRFLIMVSLKLFNFAVFIFVLFVIVILHVVSNKPLVLYFLPLVTMLAVFLPNVYV
jgi:hypothetical protein